MISHFQWKPLFNKGWKISFCYKGTHYEGIYLQSGDIEWGKMYPPNHDEPALKSDIHELMLFHIYE